MSAALDQEMRGWVPVDELLHDVTTCLQDGAVSGPALDIEVIAGPYVDFPPTGEGEPAEALAQDISARVRALRKPLGSRRGCSILVTVGEPTVARVDGTPVEELDAAAIWHSACSALRTDAATVVGFLDHTQESISVAVRGVAEASDPQTIAGYVAVVAVPAGGNPRDARPIIRALATGPARNAPFYVVGLSACPVEDLAGWASLRASVVLHGPAEPDKVVTATATPLGSSQEGIEVTVVPCPGFAPGKGVPGLTRIRIDVLKGQAEIAFSRDLGSDHHDSTVQLVQPVVSASRVTHAELRLYRHVRRVIDEGIADLATREKDTSAARAFRDHVEKEWDASGYVTLCTPDGRLAGLPATRSIRYMLLMVLRERPDGGGYDVMLSNHSPLRASRLAEWNTVLLPAFEHPYTLLEHLRDDVVRQASERAEDLARAEHAEGFEEAIAEILRTATHSDQDIWADGVRELATKSFIKISPTNGFVTEYEYHLVTLRPLIERRDGHTEATDDPMERATTKVVAWLRDLDAVCEEPPVTNSRRAIDARALKAGGGGVRFEPEVGFAEEPHHDERVRARKLPPGAVWFPVDRRGPHALWRDCPAIVARNADVMTWLDEQLDRLAKKPPRLPTDLVLGQHAGGRGYEVCETLPFDDGRRYGTGDYPDEPATSTCHALSRVRFDATSDLADHRAYAGSDFRRVYLWRQEVGARGKDREAILVLDAASFNTDDIGPGLEERALGVLRPVQRYVLTAGLERAADIDREVMSVLREEDPWGFARVRHAGVDELVSVTPPIVERLHVDDWTAEDGSEFLLCDGNHRVVDQVWNKRSLLPAVLVEAPTQPYYAYPFGALEWVATARNVLPSTPSSESKYLARDVDLDSIADPASRARVEGMAEPFRRYFRNLSSGFGWVGGQGGRWGG